MRSHPSRSTAALAAVAVVLAACGTAQDGPDQAAPDDEPTAEAPDGGSTDVDAAEASEGPDLRIVSTVAPIADVVAQVLGDRGEVHALVPAGMDSHNYEPRPSDVAPLSEADAFIDNGLDLNPAAVALAEANLPAGAPVVLLGDEALDADALSDEQWHSHDDGQPHTHGEQGSVGANPHVWTSVPNVVAYVRVIAAALTDLDPEGADGYAERAATYVEELEELDAAVRAAVDTLADDRRKLVVYHDAWTYFGREYGLEVVAAVQPSGHAEPSASDVRAIIDQIRAEDVPAVFGAEEFANSVTSAIADETGASYVGDLADDTLPGAPGDPEHSYVGMLATNAARIVDALGGDASALAPWTV
ncbi:MAG: metal ABC transporter substrate-binding protein [Nitriliruptor sp.]|uniref:metal ABC transporter substrate-binding protein n=1 Tax=Nitriliruptor sp. TaxID=2448056 RepID=UPI0034A07D2B